MNSMFYKKNVFLSEKNFNSESRQCLHFAPEKNRKNHFCPERQQDCIKTKTKLWITISENNF